MCVPFYKVLNLLTPIELYIFQHVPSTMTTTMGTRQIHHSSEKKPEGDSNCSGQSKCLKRVGHKQRSEGGGKGGGLEDKPGRLSFEKGETCLAISLYRWCEDPVSHGRIPLSTRQTEPTGLYLRTCGSHLTRVI
jgi:hypothetical protein